MDGYGLRLIQLPLQEASRFREHHPFDQPLPVTLAVRPPDKNLATPLIEPHTSSPRMVEDRQWYHKSILKKRDFVLDLEAASTFTSKLHVRYSWGAPSYSHTQFVHKSGLVLAQVLADETADFVLLPNRLASNRLSGSAKAAETTETVESITKGFKAFCRNEEALKSLYSEADRPKLPAPSPLSHAALAPDFDVPPMQLPQHLLQRTHTRQ